MCRRELRKHFCLAGESSLTGAGAEWKASIIQVNMFYYKTAYLKIQQNLTLKCGHPPLCEGGNSSLFVQGNLQMQPFARRCTKRLQQQCHFFYTQDKQDKLMAVRKQHFTLWLTDRSPALPDKQELPPLSFLCFCALCLTFRFIRQKKRPCCAHQPSFTSSQKVQFY